MGQAIGNVVLILKGEVVGSCHIQLDAELQKSSDVPGSEGSGGCPKHRSGDLGNQEPGGHQGEENGVGGRTRWGRQNAGMGVVAEEPGEELFPEKGVARNIHERCLDVHHTIMVGDCRENCSVYGE